MTTGSGFSQTEAVLGREQSSLPVSPWLIALWSSKKPPGSWKTVPVPIHAFSGTTLLLSHARRPHRRSGKRNSSLEFLFLPRALFGSLMHVWWTSASHQLEQMSSTRELLEGSLTWECTFAPPLVLAYFGVTWSWLQWKEWDRTPIFIQVTV